MDMPTVHTVNSYSQSFSRWRWFYCITLWILASLPQCITLNDQAENIHAIWVKQWQQDPPLYDNDPDYHYFKLYCGNQYTCDHYVGDTFNVKFNELFFFHIKGKNSWTLWSIHEGPWYRIHCLGIWWNMVWQFWWFCVQYWRSSRGICQ